MGRIGLAVAPVEPDMVYAIVEAAEQDRRHLPLDGRAAGAGSKRSDYGRQQPAVLPGDRRRSRRTPTASTRWTCFIQVSDDGGKTFRTLGERHKHVDNHAIWIDPDNTDHYLVGCDGGIYESFDRAANWEFKRNLPITQFYDVERGQRRAVLQRLRRHAGQLHPRRPVAHPQRARHPQLRLVRHPGRRRLPDARSIPRTRTSSTPSRSTAASCASTARPASRSASSRSRARASRPLRWNWDSPLIISPHSHTRLYFAANSLFRSDDRGDTWKAVSPRPDAADRPQQAAGDGQGLGRRTRWPRTPRPRSTATSSRSAESPKKEGLLYVGTDDGLIQVTEDGGENWRKIEKFPGVPDDTYVSDVERLAARRRHRLRRVRQPQERRLQALPAARAPTAARPGRPIAGDLPERGTRVDDRRGLREPEPALRRHRVRPVLHHRRRQEVDPAQGRPADHRRARPGDPEARERPRRRPRSAAASTSSTTTRRCARSKAGDPGAGRRPLPGEEGDDVHRGLAPGRAGQGVPGRVATTPPPIRRSAPSSPTT